MAEWTEKDDPILLLKVAQAAIIIALHDRERAGAHQPGDWMTEAVHEQFRHIETHIAQYQIGDRTIDHLAHIVCRAVIAAALPAIGHLHEEAGLLTESPPVPPTEDIATIDVILKKLSEVIETYSPESKESIAMYQFREWLENL